MRYSRRLGCVARSFRNRSTFLRSSRCSSDMYDTSPSCILSSCRASTIDTRLARSLSAASWGQRRSSTWATLSWLSW